MREVDMADQSIDYLQKIDETLKQINAKSESIATSIQHLSPWSIWLIFSVVAVVGFVYVARTFIPKFFQYLHDKELEAYKSMLDKGLEQFKAALDHVAQQHASLLRGAEAADADLRERRSEGHKALWRLTHVLPTWPRRTASYGELQKLAGDMSEWYFSGSGMYLSEHAMARYRMVQNALVTFSDDDPRHRLDPAEYDSARKYLSALRTELTRDLLARSRPFALARNVGETQPDAAPTVSGDGTRGPAPHEDLEHVPMQDRQDAIVLCSGRLEQLIALDAFTGIDTPDNLVWSEEFETRWRDLGFGDHVSDKRLDRAKRVFRAIPQRSDDKTNIEALSRAVWKSLTSTGDVSVLEVRAAVRALSRLRSDAPKTEEGRTS
jgi:hypothetical protein